MIRTTTTRTGAVALGLAWAAAAHAGPVKFDQIPADAKWVEHLDADAARSSKVITTAVRAALRPQDIAALGDISESPWTAVDFTKLHAVTAYGSRLDLDAITLVVRGEWDKETLVHKLGEKTQVKAGKTNGHPTYTWTKLKDTKLAREVTMAFPADGVMVFTTSADHLGKSLDAIGGKGENLAGAKSPLAKPQPAGAVLLSRGAGLTDADIGPTFDVFRLVRGYEYVASEHDGKWTEDLTVTADTEPTAEKLRRAADGMTALMSLAFRSQPKMAAMIDGTKTTRTGKTVHLHFQGNVDEVAAEAGKAADALREQVLSRLQMLQGLMSRPKQ